MKEFVLKLYFKIVSIALLLSMSAMLYMRWVMIPEESFELDIIFGLLAMGSMILTLLSFMHGSLVINLARSQDEIIKMELRAKSKLEVANITLEAVKTLVAKKSGITNEELKKEIEIQKKKKNV